MFSTNHFTEFAVFQESNAACLNEKFFNNIYFKICFIEAGILGLIITVIIYRYLKKGSK